MLPATKQQADIGKGYRHVRMCPQQATAKLPRRTGAGDLAAKAVPGGRAAAVLKLQQQHYQSAVLHRAAPPPTQGKMRRKLGFLVMAVRGATYGLTLLQRRRRWGGGGEGGGRRPSGPSRARAPQGHGRLLAPAGAVGVQALQQLALGLRVHGLDQQPWEVVHQEIGHGPQPVGRRSVRAAVVVDD